ncbi:hypothetical protein Glove_64g83 [Diversispora epigaea]|uniref:Uncharacterized protein n=1 Tax=Diversispora epigaea TaxID=1348612 RepID=A0A397JKX0_9GLOM|nr:hypothetical protein Glove_64g83 [Diversispora epigaea]
MLKSISLKKDIRKEFAYGFEGDSNGYSEEYSGECDRERMEGKRSEEQEEKRKRKLCEKKEEQNEMDSQK